MKLSSLIALMGIKSKRKKRRVRFLHHLEQLRLRQFNRRLGTKTRKTLNPRLRFIRSSLVKQLKQKRRKRY